VFCNHVVSLSIQVKVFIHIILNLNLTAQYPFEGTSRAASNRPLKRGSGYPLRRYLITPLGNPVTPQEVAFNRAYSSSRMVIERAFGVMKSRFRYLGIPFISLMKCLELSLSHLINIR